MRTVGVEEELLLVDVRTGKLVPVAGEILRESDDQITGEFLEQMVETRTRPQEGAQTLFRPNCGIVAGSPAAI